MTVAGAAASCTRDNPGFGNEGEATAGADATTDAADTRGETTHDETTTRSETGDTVPGATSDTGDLAETTDDPESCDVPEAKPFGVEIEISGDRPTPVCEQFSTLIGPVESTQGATIAIHPCGACDCSNQESAPWSFTFLGLPIVPSDVFEPDDCVSIAIYTTSHAGECKLDAAFLRGNEGTTAVFAAANAIDALLTDPPLELGDPICTHGTCSGGEDPGNYALRVHHEQEPTDLPPGDATLAPITIEGTGPGYMVTPVFAVVDEATCHERVTWVAVRGA